ncbi:MAG: hypothetical protein OHK0022_36210 [Roseiflexaceae bacterium]
MAPGPRVNTMTVRPAERLALLGRKLLLVPEAALITLLLGAYLLLGGATPAAFLAALLITTFSIRTLALYLARSAMETARHTEAAALINVALALHPWSADARALRGALALALGEPEQAERALRAALTLLPDQPTYLGALGCALLEQGRASEAVEVARRALELDQSSGLSHLYVAEAEHAAGHSPHQIEDRLRSGLAVATSPEILVALQSTLAGHLLAEQRLAEATLALHSAEAMLARCPAARQAELRFHLAELLVACGQTERARDYFHDVESLAPNSRYAAAAWRGARS